MKHKQSKLLCGISAALLGTAALSLHAAAASVEDVYAAMRRIGLPESMIQQAKTQYQNTEHDDAGMSINGQYFTYDVWADMVELYEDEIWEEVGKQFGVSGDDIKDASQNAQDPEAPKTEPSVPMEKPFADMTLEEKKAYVESLPESERAAFLAGLSPSERNSIIKQMSPDDQANIADGFIELGEQLGMHVSVDKLDENGINYSVRDSNGNLIDMSAVGTAVDNTGWNTTVPVLGAGAMIFGSVGGLTLLTRRSRKEDEV